MEVRRQIEVSGIVQGVGFRPFVYRLATERRLAGNIINTPCGVAIEVQGPDDSVGDFLNHLRQDAPPLAQIKAVSVVNLPCNGDREFRILASRRGEAVRTLISPDVAVCDDCLRELLDPNDRRYRYPFINCTNCGPRFTIIRDIPYDRPHTSMSVFRMCPACQAEYDNPLNRRFHAQPNACWDCGPQLELWDGSGQRMATGDPIADAIRYLRTGAVVAVKGLGGFHLAVDAINASAVALLRRRKRRVEKPFAIMVPDVSVAERLCHLNDAERRALQSIQRPIVLLRRKYRSPVADEVAPFHRDLGMFLPYTPLHHLLFADGQFTALVMTSGNLSEEPIAIDNIEAVSRLSGLADYFLVHNREILLRCDDSVVRVTGGKPAQLRRSRSYVPVPVFLHRQLPPILAVGGELKNTICMTKGNEAFLSQHIGDLENLESYNFFEEAVVHLGNVLEIEPQIIAHDLHPNYFSTQWALTKSGRPKIGVQHHHAHVASCMAENHLDGEVIGFALDGTGYGTDGHIWGGEVLVASFAGFRRTAHLQYVPLPGGEAAIREPWRMAVSYLVHHFGRDFLNLPIAFVRQLDPSKLDLLLRMLDRKINSPLTSSCGRLFDAVAALAGIRDKVNYEAQAAIELEMAMGGEESHAAYPFQIRPNGDAWVISTQPLFEGLINDLAVNVPAAEISRRFHNGLAAILADTAEAIRQCTSLDRVCLSGGTFHNVYLLERLQTQLASAGFQVFTHREVPAGDGGLSLGQALVAAHLATQS